MVMAGNFSKRHLLRATKGFPFLQGLVKWSKVEAFAVSTSRVEMLCAVTKGVESFSTLDLFLNIF